MDRMQKTVERNVKLRKRKDVEKYADILDGKMIRYGEKIMKLNAGFYAAYNNLALHLYDPDEGPFADITVNIDDLPADEFAVDVNNFPDALGILVDNQIAEFAGKQLRSGYCIYPVYRLILDK